MSELLQRFNLLRERVDAVKQKNEDLFEKFSVHINKVDIDKCYECARKLQNNFANLYGETGKIMKMSTSYFEQLEYDITQLKNRVSYLERQLEGFKFFSNYRNWVSIFVDEIYTCPGN